MNKTIKDIEDIDRIYVEYYTDPLCCWSWAFELHWRRFVNENASLIQWRYRMCGLLPDWNNYTDPLYEVSRPGQMGPLWLQAKRATGIYNDERIWDYDPPASSYPACIAMKCVEKQSSLACDLYLQFLRQAVMLHRKNIAKRSVLLMIATQLERSYPQIFDAMLFEKDLDENNGVSAFREDLLKTKFHNLTRFPAITMKKQGLKGIILVGYRPYEAFMEAFLQLMGATAKQS